VTAEPSVAISDSLRLDDQMCFALYAASRALTGVYRPMLDELGLTYPQYLVMLVLWENGPSSVKDVGAALQLDYGTLTPLLKRLQALGLVGRRRRADDERAVEVTLTEEGAALQERVAGVPVQISQALALTAEETTTLRDLLRKVQAGTARYTSKR
jgi:DNA-binding MarR family transcriptional regulator